MKLAPIVIKLRLAGTTFGNRVAGSAQLEEVLSKGTLSDEAAYVVQLSESATENEQSSAVDQKIFENFGVIVSIKNDSRQADKLGITAFDRLYDVRAEVWGALLGWQMPAELYIEGPISYVGGELIDLNLAWLWYMFEFTVPIRISDYENGIGDNSKDLDLFKKVWAQYVLTPSDDIPLVGPDGIPIEEAYGLLRSEDGTVLLESEDGQYLIEVFETFDIPLQMEQQVIEDS